MVMVVPAAAQSTERRAERSTAVLYKVRKLEILNQLLPLLLNKDQISELLPVLEKVRAEVRKVEEDEYKRLLELETKLDAAIKEGTEQSKVTGGEILRQIDINLRAMNIVRESIAAENTDALLALTQTSWNAGQRKAAANTLRPSLFDPTLDPTTMDEAAKLRFFIRFVLLDPVTYDALLEMRKFAPEKSESFEPTPVPED